MLKNHKHTLIKSAYDILAMVLKLRPHPSIRNIYTDKNNVHYRRTKWGFEEAEKYNSKLLLKRKERQYDQLYTQYCNLEDDHHQLQIRKQGLLIHIEDSDQHLKEARKEKGFLKKLLKEVLDKNTALEKRMERMVNQEENMKMQIDKLKKNKDNLFEQYQLLSEKTRQQKQQIQALQKVIEQQKNKLVQYNEESTAPME